MVMTSSLALAGYASAATDTGITSGATPPAAPGATHAGTPGARSAGDRLYPGLGNGGYDVRSYDVGFDYRAGTALMSSQVLVRALATQDLSEFSLDSAEQKIASVTVDGTPAAFRTEASAEKLVVTPARSLRRGHQFTVRISYTADRGKNPPSPADHIPPGTDWPLKSWIATKDGFAFMGQPDRAHLFFPSNDVPSDKARFTYRITTPDDVSAVANGTLVSRHAVDGDRTRFVYRTRDPIPTDVSQVAVGDFRAVTQRGPHGLPVRSYVPSADLAALKPVVSRTPGQIAWLEKKLGVPFPFESYGVLGVGSDYDGVALETATLSTFGTRALAQDAAEESPVMEHELTHQYFGDAVSVRSWDDMWLSEGHATYYQHLYGAEQGFEDMDAFMRTSYEQDAANRATQGPAGKLKFPLGVLFDTDVPGALMLYGLHDLVGDRTFQRIEATFLTTYRGRSASTQDYIDVANRVSGRDLTSYIRGWLYGATTPPMPGHPDWQPGPTS